jgi:predicted transcriptional regulator
MTLTLDLSPEQERRLSEAAQERGVDPPSLALAFITAGLATPAASTFVPRDDWERALLAASHSHSPSTHYLTDEDLSRENIYEEAG